MIEPLRGQRGFDISCTGCGVVERFALEYDRFLIAAKKAGWMIGTPRAARDILCPECVGEARMPKPLQAVAPPP